MKTISIKPGQGCFRDNNHAPIAAGIIFVWLVKKINGDKWIYNKILKISATTNIHEYIDMNGSSWNNEPNENTKIYFSWAIITPNLRTRACAAFINRYRPEYNQDYLDFFPFGETKIVCEEKIGFFEKQFIIEGEGKNETCKNLINKA